MDDLAVLLLLVAIDSLTSHRGEVQEQEAKHLLTIGQHRVADDDDKTGHPIGAERLLSESAPQEDGHRCGVSPCRQSQEVHNGPLINRTITLRVCCCRCC